MWTSLVVFLCLVACVYLLMILPAWSDRRKHSVNARTLGHISHNLPCTRKSSPVIIETDQRLFTEIRAILDRAKPLKEVRPADVRQHLKTKSLHASERRILEAMDDLVTTYDDIGSRYTRNGSLAIWRLPEQSDESVLTTALSLED
jgi:hypothetical protein